MEKQIIFSGSSNTKLSETIVKKLNKKLGAISLSTFSDGEISVEINENVSDLLKRNATFIYFFLRKSSRKAVGVCWASSRPGKPQPTA